MLIISAVSKPEIINYLKIIKYCNQKLLKYQILNFVTFKMYLTQIEYIMTIEIIKGLFFLKFK